MPILPLVYLAVIAGVAAGGYYLGTKTQKPKLTPEEEARVKQDNSLTEEQMAAYKERLRRDADLRAEEIEKQQRKEEMDKIEEEHLKKQAQADQQETARQKANDEAGLIHPIYQVITRPKPGGLAGEDEEGYWLGGKWHAVTPGERVMGPFGKPGTFDTHGNFTPEVDDPSAQPANLPGEPD